VNRLVAIAIVALGGSVAAQEHVIEHQATWPYTLDVGVLLGAEPQSRGTPIAFGIESEVLWRGLIGPSLGLFASEGSPIPPTQSASGAQPSLGDRISVPIALALRPFATVAARRPGWGGQLLAGVGVQLGIAIEHVRSSDDSDTTAGLHLALNVDVPLWGGPLKGGVALRLYGRLSVAREMHIDQSLIVEPVASVQLLAGLCYYP
jgi:hypothetical protein